jgi:purine nucleosidase
MMGAPLLIDCDTGIDDALALLYVAANGGDLRSCTVTHGNVPVSTGARNTRTVLDIVGLTDIPVYVGAAQPMAQPLRTAEMVHGEDGLGDAGVAPSTRPVSGDLAAVEIVRLARQMPGDLTLVAIGPLTNIALALLLEPRLPTLVQRVVVMGGAVGAPGNASETGEANIWHDPEAAALVVAADWDVLFVGLETTMRTALTPSAIARISSSEDPRARFAWKIMQRYLDVYERTLGERTCILHDPLAAALAIDPTLATYRTVRAFVECGSGRTRGMLVGDLRGYDRQPDGRGGDGLIRIVDEVNVGAFHERFLSSLGA